MPNSVQFPCLPCFRGAQLLLTALVLAAAPLQSQVRVASPDGRNQVTVEIRDGRLTYSLTRDGRPLILPSLLGFEFRGAPPLRDGLRITDTTRQSHDEWWTQPWGEVARVRDHHNELAVAVERPTAPPAGDSSCGCAPSTTASASATSFPSSPASARSRSPTSSPSSPWPTTPGPGGSRPTGRGWTARRCCTRPAR